MLMSFAATPAALADDLVSLKVPVFRDRAGHGLAVTEYSFETQADLLEGDAAEHSLELSGLLQASERGDVLCFAATLLAESAEDARGRDLMLPDRRRRKGQKFNALLPSSKYKTRDGEPLMLCEVETDDIRLKRSANEVRSLTLLATAVVVEARRSESIEAVVADRWVEIGFGASALVSAIEVDKKSEMTVKLKIRHAGNRDLPVIDSVYALDTRARRMGGGRWSGELELFAKGYDVELSFPLSGDEQSISRLEIVLATEYDIETIRFKVEGLFQD
ncbi:MAG: hypothetical protein ACPGYV_01635 [Phycisphaeraceae bacterium]